VPEMLEVQHICTAENGEETMFLGGLLLTPGKSQLDLTEGVPISCWLYSSVI
jgi:hypothetical protein